MIDCTQYNQQTIKNSKREGGKSELASDGAFYYGYCGK